MPPSCVERVDTVNISYLYAGILALPQQGEGDDGNAVGAAECELSGGDYDALDQTISESFTQPVQLLQVVFTHGGG